ncbi:hypothetical protein [Rhodopirellula baltica]|nr:hypothetical protein [Rhodopirellula baltica]
MGLTVDGANRALSPVIDGFQAFWLFCVVAIALFVIRAMMIQRPFDSPIEAMPEDEAKGAMNLSTFEDSYHSLAEPT